MIPYEINFSNGELNIFYNGELYEKNSVSVNICYGYGINWENTTIRQMTKVNNGFEIKIKIEKSDTLNFCFSNEKNEWDNNNLNDYSIELAQESSFVEEMNNYISSNNIEDSCIQESNNNSENNYIQESNNVENSSFLELNNKTEDTYIQEPITYYLGARPEPVLEDAPSLESLDYKKLIDGENKNTNEENEVINLCKKDNGTLLISEMQGKILLPYTADEINSILMDKNNEYKSADEVINKLYTKPFDYYRFFAMSRFIESVKLVKQREKMSIMDGMNLGNELFGKRYLHPAIISSCKNLDELNVYLDCLDKNELNDFKVFEIKYEMYPMVTQRQNQLYVKTSLITRIINFFKNIFNNKKIDKKEVNKID